MNRSLWKQQLLLGPVSYVLTRHEQSWGKPCLPAWSEATFSERRTPCKGNQLHLRLQQRKSGDFFPKRTFVLEKHTEERELASTSAQTPWFLLLVAISIILFRPTGCKTSSRSIYLTVHLIRTYTDNSWPTLLPVGYQFYTKYPIA